MEQYQHLVADRKKLVTLIIILGSIIAIGPLTIDMYLPAFSDIAHSFNAPESKVQLSLATYFIGLALGQLAYGPLVDRFGKKIPLFCGLFIFTIASIACLKAKTIDTLIIMRFFQALGACSGIVIPRAIVRDIFSPQESARIFSHLMLVMGIAPILAPIFGSFILGIFGWKAIFAFLTLFGIFCLLVSHFAIPETKGPNPDEKLSHAFKKYFGILHDRNFVVSSLSGGLTMAGLFAYITGSPFVYIQLFELSSRAYSFIFAINAVGFIIASQINARLLKKYSIEQVLGKILFLPAIAGMVLIFTGMNNAEFWPITFVLFSFLIGIGAIVPSTSALALANQASHTGSASALLGTLQFFLATIASLLVSKLHDGTAIPMTMVVGACGILAFLLYKLFK